MNHGADAFRLDKRGYGCLHIAAQYRQSLLAVFFLNKGIAVDVVGSKIETWGREEKRRKRREKRVKS